MHNRYFLRLWFYKDNDDVAKDYHYFDLNGETNEVEIFDNTQAIIEDKWYPIAVLNGEPGVIVGEDFLKNHLSCEGKDLQELIDWEIRHSNLSMVVKEGDMKYFVYLNKNFKEGDEHGYFYFNGVTFEIDRTIDGYTFEHPFLKMNRYEFKVEQFNGYFGFMVDNDFLLSFYDKDDAEQTFDSILVEAVQGCDILPVINGKACPFTTHNFYKEGKELSKGDINEMYAAAVTNDTKSDWLKKEVFKGNIQEKISYSYYEA